MGMTNQRFNVRTNGNMVYIVENDKALSGCFDSYDKTDLQGIVDKLNELNDLILEVTKSMLYYIDNERSYGDEYVASVLNDIVDEFKLRDKL